MEATWTILSGHPADTVVWRHLRTCDVVNLLCVSKSIRESTLRAVDTVPRPQTSIYAMETGDDPEWHVAIGVQVILDGHTDVCVVRATVLFRDGKPRTVPCKWHASGNPRYGKLLIAYVRRLLYKGYGRPKRICFSFTSAVPAHHSALAQQMRLVEQKFAVSCLLIAPPFADAHVGQREGVGQVLMRSQHVTFERRRIASLLFAPKQRRRLHSAYCNICSTIMFGPARTYFTARHLCTRLEARLALAEEVRQLSCQPCRPECIQCGGRL